MMKIRRCKGLVKKEIKKELSKETKDLASWLLSKIHLARNNNKRKAFKEVYEKIIGKVIIKKTKKGYTVKHKQTNRESPYRCIDCSYAILSKGDNRRIECSYYKESFSIFSSVCSNFKLAKDRHRCKHCVHYSEPELEELGAYGHCRYYNLPALPTTGTACQEFVHRGRE